MNDVSTQDEAIHNETAVESCFDSETQDRLWLRAIIPVLQLRTRESDPSGRVQLALDRMVISACERVGRIMRSDLPENPS